MKKRTQYQKLQKFINRHARATQGIVLVFTIVVVGVVLLILSSAAVPTASVEPENSSVKLPAGSTSVSGASGGRAVRFSKASSAPTGKFYIVGGQIVSPEGKIFVPNGVNGAMSPGYTFNWRGTMNGHASEVKAWGWNTVRVNITCQSANGLNDINQVNTGLDSLIAEYTAQKIVIMVECHDQTGKNPTDISSAEYAFWERLVATHKNNPYVWYNFVNEPYTGGDTAAVDSWVNLQVKLYNWLRARAPDSIFVADLPGWGQGAHTLRGTTGSVRLRQNRCNVLFGWHNYGAVSSDYNTNNNETANKQAQLDMFNYIHDNNIPVVLGELGDPLTLNEGTAGPPIWNRWGAYASFDYAPSRNIGILWWHATGDSGVFLTYALMGDRSAPWGALPNGSGLSAAGQRFWTISRAGHSQQNFTGNVANSGCASAQ